MRKQLLNLGLIASLMTSVSVSAADYEYPELLVTPSASSRLAMEAKLEAEGDYKQHLPVQIAGATTLVAGILQFTNVDVKEDTEELSPIVGVVVGGAWVAGSYLLGRNYRPYNSGLARIKKMPNKTKRDRLARERMAEEVIDNAAKVGNRLMYISTATNFLASGFMLMNAKSKTSSIPAAGLAMVTSIAPFIFRYNWQTTSKQQRNYKKKIYSPVVSNAFFMAPKSKKIVPGIALNWVF